MAGIGRSQPFLPFLTTTTWRLRECDGPKDRRGLFSPGPCRWRWFFLPSPLFWRRRYRNVFLTGDHVWKTPIHSTVQHRTSLINERKSWSAGNLFFRRLKWMACVCQEGIVCETSCHWEHRRLSLNSTDTCIMTFGSFFHSFSFKYVCFGFWNTVFSAVHHPTSALIPLIHYIQSSVVIVAYNKCLETREAGLKVHHRNLSPFGLCVIYLYCNWTLLLIDITS